MFSSEYCEIFNLLTAALTLLNSYRKAVSSYFCNDSFLSLDNILTGYEKLVNNNSKFISKFIDLCFISKRLIHVT